MAKESITPQKPLRADKGNIEDDDVLMEDSYAIPQATLTPAELMNQLVQSAAPVTTNELFALSDLSRPNADLVRREWSLVALDRRRSVMRRLIELATDNIDWDLTRMVRIGMDDPDAHVRQLALTALGDGNPVSLVGPLLQIMRQDPDGDVRASAAAALGSYVLAGELDELDAAQAMRIEEALLAVLNNSNEPIILRARALESMAYSGEIGVRQSIETAYYSPEEELRVAALVAMGRSADVRWRGLVRAELQNPTAAMRAEAARACGELEVTDALKDLLYLVHDEVRDVRLAAIFALGRIGGRDAKEVLQALVAGKEPAEAAAAEEALDEITFYVDSSGISVLDELPDNWDEGDDEPWDDPNRALGEYGQ